MKGAWDKIPAETKKLIKNYAFSAIASPYKSARKGALLAVATIAQIEIPKKEWPEIIPILSASAQGTDINSKLSSLEIQGIICDDLEKSDLSPDQVDTILNGLVLNITSAQSTDQIKILALSSLCTCLHLCSKNFNTDHEKDILMTNIITCISSTNDEVRLKALNCVMEVVRCFYDSIGASTLEHIGQATFPEIKRTESEETSLIAIEIWSSICDVEIEREIKKDPKLQSKNLIATASGPLVPLLLECLKRKPENEDDDWNTSVSAACCLSLMTEIIKDQMVPPIFAFISANIGAAEWENRCAGILAFGSILKGPQKDTTNTLVNAALPTMTSMLQDKKETVRLRTSWLFEKITKTAHGSICNPQMLDIIMAGLLTSIKDKPQISFQICFAISNVAYSLRANEGQQSSLMSKIFTSVLEALWSNALRPDAFTESKNLAYASFEAMTSLIQYSANDTIPLIETVLQKLIETFQSTVKGSFTVPAKTVEYQGYLCTTLQSIFSKLSGRLNADLADSFILLLIESFTQRKNVYDEGILAICGLINCLGKDFNKYMAKLGPYIFFAMKAQNDAILCKAAVDCVQDLARVLEDQMSPYLDSIFPILIEILKNSDTERTIKLGVITALGDLAVSTGKFFTQYFHDSLEMLKSAAILSVQPQEDV